MEGREGGIPVTGSQREAIDKLLAMDTVTVNADQLAPALSMSPGVLRQHVKDGDYLVSKYDYNKKSGRIRFFRKSFLQAIGEMPLDPPERTEADLLEEIIELIRVQNTMLMELLASTKKTAGAATPTD
jgi:hypothetical protein